MKNPKVRVMISLIVSSVMWYAGLILNITPVLNLMLAMLIISMFFEVIGFWGLIFAKFMMTQKSEKYAGMAEVKKDDLEMMKGVIEGSEALEMPMYKYPMIIVSLVISSYMVSYFSIAWGVVGFVSWVSGILLNGSMKSASVVFKGIIDGLEE